LRTLRLKSVVALIPEDYPKAMVDFYASVGTRLLTHGLDGNKWPSKEIKLEDFSRCLADIMDPQNRPLLIHCNKGKHRTGSVIGCLRKLNSWALSAIFAEYLAFSSPKSRFEDQIFIEQFDIGVFRRFVESERARKVIAADGHGQADVAGGLSSSSSSSSSSAAAAAAVDDDPSKTETLVVVSMDKGTT